MIRDDLAHSFRRRPGSAVPPSSLRLKQLYGPRAEETREHQRVQLLMELGKEGLELLIREAYAAGDSLGVDLAVFEEVPEDETTDAAGAGGIDSEDRDLGKEPEESFNLFSKGGGGEQSAAENSSDGVSSTTLPSADGGDGETNTEDELPHQPPANPRALLELRRARIAAHKVRVLEKRVAELEAERARNQRQGKELGDQWAAEAVAAPLPQAALKKADAEIAKVRMREEKEQQDRRAKARDFGNAVARRAPNAKAPPEAVSALLEKRQRTEHEELQRIERKKEAARIANERSRADNSDPDGNDSKKVPAVIANLLAKRQQTKNEELARLERRKEVRERFNEQSLAAPTAHVPSDALRKLMEQRQQTKNEELARIERRKEAARNANEISRNWKKIQAVPALVGLMKRRATVERDETGTIVPRPPRTASPGMQGPRGRRPGTPSSDNK